MKRIYWGVVIALWLYAALGYTVVRMMHVWIPDLRLQALLVAMVMTMVGVVYNYFTRAAAPRQTLAGRLNDGGLAGGTARPSTPHAQDN